MVRQGGVALLVFGLGYRPGQLIRDGQPWCSGRSWVISVAVRTGGVSRVPDQVAAIAEAVATTGRGRDDGLDRLSRIFRCRDKGTFVARIMRCISPPIATATVPVTGICAWDSARVRAPG